MMIPFRRRVAPSPKPVFHPLWSLPSIVLMMAGFACHSVRGEETTGANQPRYYRQVERGPAKTIAYDVVVYGGTPAGVTAAIQAARMGKKTVLLSFNRHVGGMTSGGLTATDIGKRDAIDGMAMEFYNRIETIKGFRPSEAESLFQKMLAEAGVPVLLGRCLESVERNDGRLVSATMETGETFKAVMFVDATYEGDLLAAAHVSYQVGREPAAAYDESLGGQWQEISWKNVYQFCRLPISPYVKPGDPESGLLPEIATEPPGKPGKPGKGDCKVQAYNFLIFLTNKEGRIPLPKPQDYDPGRFALLARFLNFDPSPRWTLNYTVKPMTDAASVEARDPELGTITELTPSIPQYFSWINNTNEGATEAHTMTNLKFFKWLHDEYGMRMGIYAWDAGNMDSANYYGNMETDKFKSQFPNGWGPCAELADSFDCRLGIWGGPDGFGDTPEEEQARTDMLVRMVRDFNVQLFKFDAVCGQLRDEKQDAFANAMIQCRKHAPDLIVLNHRLNLGHALPHATTFLMGGAETYIDVHMTNSTTGTHNRVSAISRGLPPELKRLTEDCGVCLSSCLDFWEDDLVLQAFNRSLILAPETYGNPWLLRDDEFPKFARIHNLHYRNREILVRGIVLPEESYGPNAVSRGDAGTRFLTLRNLTWEPVTYQVELNEEIGLTKKGAVRLRRYHPSESLMGRHEYGKTVEVTVDPFRSFLLLATVERTGELGVMGSDYEVVRDTEGKDAIIKVLGMPGTEAKIRVLRAGREFTNAFIDGRPAQDVLTREGLKITFPGKEINSDWHAKLGTLERLNTVPPDAASLYEATCYSAQNTSLESQSAVRSGETRVPQVQAARDAFFNQNLFWRRGISDQYMFDGKLETFFGTYNRNRDQRLNGGALRIDLQRKTAINGISVKALWTDQENRPAPDTLIAEFSNDLTTWTEVTLTRDQNVEDKIKIANVSKNGGEHELVDSDLTEWRGNFSQASEYRFMKIVNSPGRIAELEISSGGKPIAARGWKGTNLFSDYQAEEAAAAWQTTVTVPADAAEHAYLCVPMAGEHGKNKAFAAIRVDGKLVGATQRAPSFPAVVFEYGPSQRSANNTYFFPITNELRGKKIDIVVLAMDQNKTDFTSEVWITAYPTPCQSMQLVLKK